MRAWVPEIFTCRTCHDSKEAKQMFSETLCKMCNNDEIAEKRTRYRVWKKTCQECKKARDMTQVRKRMRNGKVIEVCSFCIENCLCKMCNKTVKKSQTIEDICDNCRTSMARLLKLQQLRESLNKRFCALCSGHFDVVEMIDNCCIYCTFESPDQAKVKQVAERMKCDPIVRERFLAYIYNCQRLGDNQMRG